jgi:hypothetical protein
LESGISELATGQLGHEHEASARGRQPEASARDRPLRGSVLECVRFSGALRAGCRALTFCSERHDAKRCESPALQTAVGRTRALPQDFSPQAKPADRQRLRVVDMSCVRPPGSTLCKEREAGPAAPRQALLRPESACPFVAAVPAATAASARRPTRSPRRLPGVGEGWRQLSGSVHQNTIVIFLSIM